MVKHHKNPKSNILPKTVLRLNHGESCPKCDNFQGKLAYHKGLTQEMEGTHDSPWPLPSGPELTM